MYTANIVSKSIQRSAKKVVVDVEFSGDDKVTFTEQFDFPLSVTENDIKIKVKQFITSLEKIQNEIETVLPIGELDYPSAEETKQDAINVAYREWVTLFLTCKAVKELVDLGIVDANDQVVTSTTNAARAAFNPAFVEMLL